MKTHSLIQGSPEWLAHRAQHFNASDAPAMMGCSPHETRTQLMHRLHTGIAPEVDPETQRRFDAGHRFEALARPLAEKIIGEDLFPVTGSEGKYSASFDGLTMVEHIAFEHKSLNAELRFALVKGRTGADLPLMYRVQMEHQAMVSGCERVLFMASHWEDGALLAEGHCWYEPDLALRAQIVAGWEQFEKDLAEYVPSEIKTEKVVAEAVEALPAPVVQVSGQIALQDNFKVFEQRLRDFLENKLIRKPESDQDFADLDEQIRAMKKAREALKAAEAQMLAQVQPVDQAKKTKDMLDSLLQQNVKLAEDILKAEKDRRKLEIVNAGATKFKAHIDAMNTRLGKPYMPTIATDFGGVVKGLKSLASMESKVSDELARAKIEAGAIADRIDLNLQYLRDNAADYRALFPDAAVIVLKATDDLQALVKSRIAEHQAAEQSRLEAERAAIRAEEQAKAEREAREKLEAEQAAAKAAAPAPEQAPAPAAPVAAPTPTANVIAMHARAPVDTGKRIKLGDINARLAPLSLSADNLAALGFTHVATDKAAKLYRESDFTLICAAIVKHVEGVQAKQAA